MDKEEGVKPDDPEALRRLAADAAERAHAPYSGLRVGAALRTARGHTFVGCNVENGALPLSQCAERSAIAAAVVAEGAACRIVDLAIHAENAAGDALPAAPCGGCRQCIFEFGPEAIVHFRAADGAWLSQGLNMLLPHAYRLPLRPNAA